VEIRPASQTIGPIGYELAFDSPTVQRGTLSATQTGRATGTYQVTTPATGRVTLYNFNSVPVGVPQGTQVAAGSVPFATVEAVVVGPGAIAPGGQIAAGEAQVGVTATAPGPGGNLAADAIDRVVDPSLDAALRAYPNNDRRVVDNLAPTAGGTRRSGAVVQESDVDAAVASLRAQLAAQLAARLAPDPGLVVADATGSGQAAIPVPSGLVGKRDTPSFQLVGTLAYDRASVRASEVEAAASARVATDPYAVPSGRSLVAGSLSVQRGEPRRVGDRVLLPVTVTARTIPRVDSEAVRRAVLGKSPGEAAAALRYLGEARVSLWPGWVREVPRLPFRVDIQVRAAP
jgi:hypothetical protein